MSSPEVFEIEIAHALTRVPDQPAFLLLAEFFEQAELQDDQEAYWLAVAGPDTEILLGGEGTDIVIGVPGQALLVGGIV